LALRILVSSYLGIFVSLHLNAAEQCSLKRCYLRKLGSPYLGIFVSWYLGILVSSYLCINNAAEQCSWKRCYLRKLGSSYLGIFVSWYLRGKKWDFVRPPLPRLGIFHISPCLFLTAYLTHFLWNYKVCAILHQFNT
jgi:hypothetical protein